MGTPFADALLLGIRIRVAGVAGPPVVDCDCAGTCGDLEESPGTAGGGIRLSESGSGETELSLLLSTLPDVEPGLRRSLLFGS